MSSPEVRVSRKNAKAKDGSSESVANINWTTVYFPGMVDCVLEALIAVDNQGKVVGWNVSAERVYGRTAEETMGKQLDDFLETGHVGTTKEDVIRLAQETGNWSGEVSQTKKDGTRISVWSSVSPVRDEKGKPAGFIHVNRDVSEQKMVGGAKQESEAKLRESREYFRTIADFTYDWEYWLDDDLRILYTSPSCERITGYSAEQFEQDPSLLEKIIHPEDRLLYMSHIREEIQKTEPVSLDFRIVTASGEVRWINHACQRVRVADGHSRGRRVSNRDITQRRQMEQSLRENESILTMAEEVSQMGSWRLDLRTRKVTWSEQMFRLFEVDRDSFNGELDRVMSERVHPDDLERVLEFNRSMLSGISSIASLNYRIVQPDGRERAVRMLGKLVRDEAGHPASMIGYMQEVTEWVEVQKQVFHMKRLYAILSEVNQTIVRVKDRDELFHSICDIVVKFGEFSLAWVGILDEVTGKVVPVAANGLDVNHWPFEVLNVYEDSNKNSLAVTAIRTSKVVTSEDVQSEESTRHLRRVLQKYGYHSSAAVPFHLSGKTIGVLTLVSRELDLFKATEETRLLNEMGMDISFALDTMEAEKVKRQWADAFEHCTHGIAIELPSGSLLTCNPAFTRLQGRTVEEVFSMPTLEMCIPADRERIKQYIVEADHTGRSQYEAHMLHKNGSTYPVQMDVVSVRDENGHLLYRVVTQQDITGRRQAEQMIGALAKFPSENPSPVLRVDKDGVILYANPASGPVLMTWERETGQTVPDEWRERFLSVLRSGEAEEVEISFQGREFSCNLAPIVDEGYVNIYGRDVTKRRRAELALRQSEERYRHTLDSMLEGCQIIGSDWRYLYVNDTVVRQGRATREELLGRTMMEVYPGIETTELFGVLRDCMESRRSRQIENEFAYPDGSKGYFELGIEPAEEGIFILSSDITERRLAEEKYRQIFENAAEAITQTTPEGKYVSANPATARMLGYASVQDLVTNLFDLGHQFYVQPGRRDEFMKLMQEHGSISDFESEVYRKDGSHIWLLETSRAIHDKGGKLLYYEGGARDITDRKRADEAISKSERQMRALLTSLDDIVFEFDHEGTCLNIWVSNENLLPQPKAQMLGRHIFDVMGWEQGTLFYDAIKRVLTECAPETIEYPQTIMGGQCWFMARVSPILGQDGSRHTVSVLVREITGRKQVEKQVETQLERLRALSEIDRAISSSLDMRLSLDVLLDQVISQLGVDAASILLLNTSGQTLEYEAGKGFRSLKIRDSRMLLGQGLAGRTGLGRRIVYVPNLPESGEQFLRRELLEEEEFVDYFGVPLIAKGVCKGVLEVFHRSRLNPDVEWMNYLETLGGQAAIAIDNAQLFEGMQRSNLELVTAYDATIEGWSRAVDLRDKEAEGHTQRVAELTVKLARKIGMGQHDIVQLRRGALLHDIGKLGIPDQVLHKPAPLDTLEWAIMRQHPTYAFNMLVSINYLRPALDIPYCHHEKWDGNGYPRGLKAENIPLAARIFTVVDVWDALRSPRPYRTGWPSEKIHDHLAAESGRHFDPQVLNVFMQLIEED
jgi:PAS domain S-box-containing protein